MICPLVCQHERWQYARRVLNDGTHHLCAQCIVCHSAIKLSQHSNNLWLKPSEIPSDAVIHPFIEARNHG